MPGRQDPTDAIADSPHLSNYRDAMAWFARENATLLAVVDFAARNGLTEHVERLVSAFHTFLYRSGQLHERAAAHRTALDTATTDKVRLFARAALARALARLGRLDEAERLLDEAAAT